MKKRSADRWNFAESAANYARKLAEQLNEIDATTPAVAVARKTEAPLWPSPQVQFQLMCPKKGGPGGYHSVQYPGHIPPIDLGNLWNPHHSAPETLFRHHTFHISTSSSTTKLFKLPNRTTVSVFIF